MKRVTGLLACFLVSLICAGNISAQSANGCSGGKRLGIFYTDCWTDTGDDTTRLQSAIDAATGKLIFNEDGYSINDTLTLHSHLVIEGLSTKKYDVSTPTQRITQTADSESVFFIGAGARQISIRDLGLYSDGTAVSSNTNGILAEANTGASSGQGFEFTNLRFTNFTRGIFVNSNYPSYGWQFDDAHISDSTFEECQYAIYLNATNTGWEMNNLMFTSAETQNGVWIERGGYVSMNMLVGNGNPTEGFGDAGEFIHIEYHGPVTIKNSNAEAYERHLFIDGIDGFKYFPIVLTNNILPACPFDAGEDDDASGVVIKNASVVSEGNAYFCIAHNESEVSRPSIEGWADVYSTGDKFCLDGESECFSEGLRSEFAVKSYTAVLRSDNLFDLSDWNKPLVDITSSYSWGEGPVYKPLLALTTSFWNSPSAGDIYKVSYTFKRNGADGWLELEGSQSAPYTGYRLKNGPVQLTSVAQSALSGYNSTSAAGSMLYCSDCTAVTNPCSTAGGGGGALALKVASGNWSCK